MGTYTWLAIALWTAPSPDLAVFPIEPSSAQTRPLDAAVAKQLGAKSLKAKAGCDPCKIDVAKKAKVTRALAPRITRRGDTCTVSMVLFDLATDATAIGGVAEGRCAELATVVKNAASLVGGRTTGKLSADGKRDGMWTVFRADETKFSLATYASGVLEGQSIAYDEDGEVAISTTYVGGKKNGRYREWKRKGDTRLLHVEGEYTDGEKDGVWTVYDDAGHPIELTTWVMGAIKK